MWGATSARMGRARVSGGESFVPPNIRVDVCGGR